MEQQERTKKNVGYQPSEMQNAEKGIPETKDTKNTVLGNKSTNKETPEMIHSEKITSKTFDNKINSPSNIVKDRGKTECLDERETYSNTTPTKNKREFRESAKYRDAESYAVQHHHSIGEGLYLTDEIQDLPPRFRQKVVNALKNADALNRQKAAKALEEAAALNNIKLDRNPLEYFTDSYPIKHFTSYDDDSKQSDKTQDKLVCIPSHILEDERKSSTSKSSFGPSLKNNFIAKTSSDSNHHSNPTANNLERRKQFSDNNLVSQPLSQNFRNKTGFKPKPPFPRSNDNEFGTRQKNSTVSQFNVKQTQSQVLNHQETNVSVSSSLPPKPFKNSSKFPLSKASSSKSISDSHSYNSYHQHSNDNSTEGYDHIAFYQDLNEKHKRFPNKSSDNSNNSGYGKKISVDELFGQNKASLVVDERKRSSSELNKIPDANDRTSFNDSKFHDKQRTFTNPKTQYENKRPFKSQARYSESNSTPLCENKFRGDFSKSGKNSDNQTNSYFPNNTITVKSIKGVKSEKKQFQSDTISEKSNTFKYNDNKYERLNVQENVSKSPNYSGESNFSKSNDTPPKNYAKGKSKHFDNYSYSKTEKIENYPNKERSSDNSSKIFGIPSEKEESSMVQVLPLNNISVQNKNRTRSDSRSSISSSHSSKSFGKAPQHKDFHSNMKDSFRNDVHNVNSNHNSLESISQQKFMHKQLDREENNFNKKTKNCRYHRETYSDSSSVLSDKSIGTSNSFDSRESDFNRKSKNYRQHRQIDNDSSSVLSDKFVGRSNFSNNSKSNERCNQRDSRESDFDKKSMNHRRRETFRDSSSSVLSDKSLEAPNFSNSYSNETCNQRDSESFAKPPGKHFNEKRGGKSFQNSQSSLRGQELSQRKHNSFSPAKHNHYSDKVDDTSNRSTYSDDYHKSRSTEYRRENENNVRVCTENGFFIKVEVSENATDLEKWMKYFQNIFKFHFEFERCCRFSDVFILEFERKEHAYTACDILHKEKKMLQNSNKPHVLSLTKLLYRLVKPCNCNRKVISDCLDNLEKHFKSSLTVLRSKFKDEHCISTQKKNYSRNKYNSEESEILKKSISAFTKFKEETVSFVKDAPDLRTVQQHRHSFIRECNIFKRCLPIYSKKFEILDLARFYSVSVIVAETGSGKSTQLVEYLLHSSKFDHGFIICTQPRKLAAISIAQFVSGQIGSAIGKIIGYDVGTEKKYNDNETKVIYMTDYCLLKYLLQNRNLKGVSCIIIDEAHERSLYTDLILGLLKKCLDIRRDLSVLITSATINPAVFVDYFNMSEECVIEVPGRTYPVDVVWFPEDVEIGWDYLDACVHQAYDIHIHNDEGDILVFLTSPSESEEAIYLFKRLLRKRDATPKLLSLHGKTDIQEQMLIFQKNIKSSRKIIFATNVAETAVTIPGIKYVIDSGMSKELMFDPQKNKSYLAVTFTTKSAAEQRKGRAGRTQSGICYRMYSKRNFAEDMSDNVIPEILKSNLQKALLKIFEFGIDPENFDFIEAPPARTISNSVESLEHLGAISNKKLTDFGKKLAKLPLEPQLSKLILQGIEAKIGIESIIIAVLVSESSKLFIRNEENRALADAKKRKFCHEGGDLCTYLEIYKNWKLVDIPKRYDWCVENYVSFKALSAAAKTVKEILITLRTELKLPISSQFNNIDFKKQYEKIIFDSFSENLCVLSGHPKLGYLSPYLSESFFIHPSSTLSYLGKDSPEFLVYGTLMETSRNFLFDVTPISEATLKSAYLSGKFRLPLHTLRCLQIPPKIMGPFGESVLIRHILGKGGSKIRDLEKTLKELTSVKSLYVDVDVTKGLLTVYLSNRLHEKAENHIQQIISKAHAEMLNEEDVAKLSGTCLYFALSAGGVISDIIMPGEFRELIFNRVSSIDSNELESILQRYGLLQSFSRVKSKQEMQICATFKKVCDAKEAYLNLKQGKKYFVSPKPHLPALNNKPLPMHMLLMSWCCRPSTGYGFVELFSEDDLIEASGTLTCNSFFVGNNLIMFEVANAKRKLAMKNLPEHVEEHTIREKLKEILPHIKIKFIDILRKKVRITHGTVEESKAKLLKLLSLYISSSKFTLDLKDPEQEASWNAVVYFEKAQDAEHIFMKLKDSTCIDSYPLSIRLIFKCQLLCEKSVYDIVSVQVNDILKLEKAKGLCNDFSTKLLKQKEFENDKVLVEFSCVNEENLNKLRQNLQSYLEGIYFELMGNSKYHFLFLEGYVEQIKKIQRSTETVISIHEIKKAITIYGSPENCRKAKSEIHQLAYSPDCSITRSFNLEDSCIPNGFLKELYLKYGYNLDGLAANFKLAVALIDNNGHTLTLKGSKEQIRKAEHTLEKICEQLFQSRGKRQKASSDDEVCSICFDPVSFDFQRLEHCGHAFCRQCLLLQLESKTMPLACVKQDCEKLIFLEDIKRIISLGGDHLKKSFCTVALQHHVSCNIGKLSYCRTPDCQMIYRVTKESSEYSCPGCNNATCTRCQSPYHYGMSCDMYQKCKKDVDYSLKEWVKENKSTRKFCPSCKVVIEKADGCNHMQCLNCKVHLCWLCLKIFPIGDEVYEHMPYCPKNQ